MRWTLLVILTGTLGCRTSTVQHITGRTRSAHSDNTMLPGLASWNPHLDSERAAVAAAGWNAGSRSQAGVFPASAFRLTLNEAIHTALAKNPDLVALRRSEAVSVAALEVARTYPFNPQVSVDVRPFTREAGGESAAVLVATSVLQEIELAHQGRYRERAGSEELERTRRSILQAEIATMAQTEQRFFAALYQRERHELAESLAELNQEMLEVLERRFEAGQASATDVALARIQAASTRQQSELAWASYQAASVELRSQLGLSETATVEPMGDLGKWTWLPSPAGVTVAEDRTGKDTGTVGTEAKALANLVASRPDVLAAEAEVASARARLHLASAARVPNVKAGPVYEHDEAGTTFFGVEAQVLLPVINTGAPLVRQRQAELRQREVAWEQLQVKAKLEVRAAVERYEQARGVVERYGGDFSEGLAREVHRIEEQFAAGQADLIRVYSARTSMIQSRLMYLDSL
ncbi:MAG: TolC family protein, partial [Planctomycetes bacterium]|nr:TolC family protein [Planctomycetota bacterium]